MWRYHFLQSTVYKVCIPFSRTCELYYNKVIMVFVLFMFIFYNNSSITLAFGSSSVLFRYHVPAVWSLCEILMTVTDNILTSQKKHDKPCSGTLKITNVCKSDKLKSGWLQDQSIPSVNSRCNRTRFSILFCPLNVCLCLRCSVHAYVLGRFCAITFYPFLRETKICNNLLTIWG